MFFVRSAVRIEERGPVLAAVIMLERGGGGFGGGGQETGEDGSEIAYTAERECGRGM